MKDNTMVYEYKKEAVKKLNTALYIRLSRDDGDKSESLSIGNQRLLLTEYLNKQDELRLYDIYIDDGYTGTNFNRPGFQRMIEDIENKNVQCVIVKDLSRLGRNMPKVSEYINEYFPSKKVRFIAVNDLVDKQYYDVDTSEDMMIDVKNLFNGFYPKDISKKVRSTFRTKQNNGQFIGAFASYGYRKSEHDHNKLVIDDYAANIIKRIFDMYISGMGQNTIAKILNEEGEPCPSEYKKHCGLNYHNGNRLNTTYYWTYSTIRKILQNEIYIGNMVQNKSFRQVCKKNAISLPKDKWIIVKNTHEPIIDKNTWNKVQNLLKRNTRQTGLTQNIHIFAGFLKCGECGRAMVKITRKGVITFNCGSYNRYGKKFCSIHSITEKELERIVLNDLNIIIKSVKDMKQLIKQEQEQQKDSVHAIFGDISKYQLEIKKIEKKKERAYEDYSEDIISKIDYLKYKKKYEQQISVVQSKIDTINQIKESKSFTTNPWIEKLLQYEQLEHLDRQIVVEMVSMIEVFENHTIKIVYNFSDELEVLLGNSEKHSKDFQQEDITTVKEDTV